MKFIRVCHRVQHLQADEGSGMIGQKLGCDALKQDFKQSQEGRKEWQIALKSVPRLGQREPTFSSSCGPVVRCRLYHQGTEL